jgi:hypothetical protein
VVLQSRSALFQGSVVNDLLYLDFDQAMLRGTQGLNTEIHS